MSVVTVACHAMATRFEIVLHGERPAALRAAGEEALRVVEELEAQLSLFRPASEIAHLNARAAREPVRVTPGLFALLQQAQRLHAESDGAFDITIGPLVRCWGYMGGDGRLPRAEEVAEASKHVGMALVRLNPEDLTVQFAREGVMLNLGALGKGYAVERAAEVLREAGVASALIHGGTSTVQAIGQPPGENFWKIAIETPSPLSDRPPVARHVIPGRPGESADSPSPALKGTLSVNLGTTDGPLTLSLSPLEGERVPFRAGEGFKGTERDSAARSLLAVVPLKDEAMSVSGVWGNSFQVGDRTCGHIIDPRTGEPAVGTVLAAVVLPSATETDALSTALLVLGSAGHQKIASLRGGMRTLVVSESGGQLKVEANGIAVR